MNATPKLSPDEIARACADAMWAEDDASSGLGMEIVDVRPGQATLTMTVQPHMVNGQRIAHGGFIFLLADSTVKERILEIKEEQLCVVDPANAALSARSVIVPTPALLDLFDRHLLALAKEL